MSDTLFHLSAAKARAIGVDDYKRMYDRSAIAIFRSTPDGRYIMANPAGVRLHGYDSEADLLRAVRDIADEVYVDPKDRQALRHRLEQHGAAEGFECEIYRHKTRERIWVRQNIFQIAGEDGRLSYLEGYVEDITERKRAEEENKRYRAELERRMEERTAQLRSSEERYRAIFDTAAAGIGRTLLKDGKVLLANKKLARMFGYESVERYVAEFVFSEHYVNPADRDRLLSSYRDSPGTPIECAFTKRDGSPVVVEAHAIPNEAEGILDFVVTDITERKRAEARLDQAMDVTPAAFALFDPDDRLVICNRRYREMYGTEALPVVPGVTFESLVRAFAAETGIRGSADDVEAWTARRLGRRAAPAQSFVYQRADGDWIEVSDHVLEDGSIFTIGLIVTGRKQDEERLRASEERLKTAARMAKLGYFVWDLVEDRCTYCDEEYARIHGITAEEYMAAGADLERDIEWIHPDDRDHFRKVLKTAIERTEPLTAEYRIVRKDGQIRHVREVEQYLEVKDGIGVRTEGTLQDITEIKLAEEQLRQAQKMEAVGQLTGGVAHDFNNLLSVIQGNAELLKGQVDPEDPMLTSILRASRRGAELTQRLLAFSRRQALRPRPCNLRDLVTAATELLKRTLGETIEVASVMESGLSQVLADPGQLENALLNLAVNARDAMPEGGRLTIECRNARLDEAYAARNPETVVGDYVVLAVSDDGTGMTPDVQAQAFEPFFTTKEVGKGSGLGLSMVYGFAKQSGGHAAIYSEPGKGTTVKLYLPTVDGAAAPGAPLPDPTGPRGRGERVLAVEDDPEVRRTLVAMLERLGYRTRAVSDARQALKVLDQGVVDVVLSDVVLPGGTSGPEFAALARARFPTLEVLFMSGYPAGAAKRSGFLAADQVLLNKPFQIDRLASALRDAIDRTKGDRD